METQLQRFEHEGLELIINTESGESFATAKGYSRMTGKDYDTIKKRCQRGGLENAEIPTEQGIKRGTLITEDLIAEWLPKDNPTIATKMMKLGVRAFLHTLAGYKVSSTATKPKELTPLDILEQQVKWMRHTEAELHKAQLEIQELKEFKAEIRQTQQEAVAHLKHLDPPTLTAAPLCTKEKLNRLIRDYSLANKLSFSYVYNWVYREFRDRYHVDLKVRGKNHKPKLTGTEYADRYDLIENSTLLVLKFLSNFYANSYCTT